MHLEKLFRLYLGQAKHQAPTLLDNDRRKACQWIQKIEQATVPEEQDKIIQLHALKLLLLCLESNCFTGPFEEPPIDDKEITEYDWNSYPLNTFSDMIRSKKDSQKRPDVSYAVSGNRRELVTYQDDPATGQHCYYAHSREPIEEWENLEGGAIHNESIKNWQERGEFEELNQYESQNSSIDVPRCVKKILSPEVDFCIHDERHSDLRHRIPNSTNKSVNTTPCPGPSRPQTYQRIQIERPETPLGFGGRAVNRPYGNEEFGISQNEQFRSPRGVFENLDYDQPQSCRGPMAPRLTDEVIDSFENAKARLAPTSETREQSKQQHQQHLRARLQGIRNEMNQKPQEEAAEQQNEDEHETFHYEPITLQEPCDEIGNSRRHHVSGQDPSILTSIDMNNEDMFGEQRTIDPRTIFKTRDENLISRNVMKIETNTTITENKREVTEEILEEEDVNVQQRTQADENLEDVSEPVFESPPGYSPLRFQERTPIRSRQILRQPKPRRIAVDYSDLPQEDLEDISQPSFQQESVSQCKGRTTPHNFIKNRGNTSEFISQASTATDQADSSSKRRFQHVYDSERLDDVEQPDFCSSIGNSRLNSGHGACNTRNSEQLENICPPEFPSSFEDSSRKSRGFPEIDNSERLESVSQPIYPSSFENTSKQGQFPQMEKSERLDSIEQPDFESFEESTIRSRRSKCPSTQRALPQVDESEMLADVCQPDFQSFKDSTSQSRRRGVPEDRSMSYVETSERLDQVTPPGFQSTLRSSTLKSRQNSGRSPNRRLPPGETSVRLCDKSQPIFRNSYEDSRCRTGRQNVKQTSVTHERLDDVSRPDFAPSIDCSMQRSGHREFLPHQANNELETLEDVSQPNFEYSKEDSKNIYAERRCLQDRRALPYVDVSERLDSVCQPDFPSSVKDSTRGSGRNMLPRQQRPFPQVDESEMLDDVDHLDFASLLQESSQVRRVPKQRYLPNINNSEVLEGVSQPIFHSSFENSRQRPILDKRNRNASKEKEDTIQQTSLGSSMPRSEFVQPNRPLPQFNESEQLDDVVQPDFQSSFKNSTSRQASRVNRQNQQRRPQHILDASEKLNDVSQPFLPTSFEDSSHISSGKRIHSPKQISTVVNSKELEEMTIPTFHSSLEESSNRSRRSKSRSTQRPFHQIDESEKLENISQPAYPSSFVHSTAISSGNNFQKQSPCPYDSEKLDEIQPPNFPSSFEDSRCTPMRRSARKQINRHQRVCPEEHSERLDDVCQPEFPISFEDSRCCSERNKTGNIQKSFPSEILENISHGKSRSLQTQEPPCEMSGRNRNTARQRYCAVANTSERLDDICQPEFPNSFEDSRHSSRRHRSRLLQESHPREILDDISQPNFSCTLDRSVQRSSYNSARCLQQQQPQFEPCEMSGRNRNTPEQRHRTGADTSERLEDVCQPEFPNSFEDSRRSKSRNMQKSLPSEFLEDVTTPEFSCSLDRSMPKTTENRTKCLQGQQPQFGPFEMSGRNRNMQHQRHRTGTDISERLDDVCQPEFPTSFEDSRRNKSRNMQKSLPSEFIEDVTTPEFSCSLDRSMPKTTENRTKCLQGQQPQFGPFEMSGRNKNMQQQIYRTKEDISERLENVCQPEFFDSGHFSRGSRHRHLQKSVPTEILEDVTQPNFTCCLDRSRQKSSDNRRERFPFQRFQFDDSVMLEDIVEPEFPSTFQDSLNISRDRRKTNPEKRHLPQVDISENIENVCQPEFPISFDHSENGPSTYRKNFDPSSNTPEENLDNVSAPTFHSDNQDPMPRNLNSFCLPAENIDSQGSSRRRLEDRRPRGPQRQIFPKQKLTIVDTERLGDYTQVFESMPNYAPFEEQIVPTRNPNAPAAAAFPSRLKMPGTFGQTMAHSARNNEPPRHPEMQFPHHKMQPPQISKIKRGPCAMPYTQMKTQPIGEFCPNKLRLPTYRNDVNPSKLQTHSNKNNISPKASSTKIGLVGGGGRSQTKIQRPQHRSTRELPDDQERLVKKSLVKFQITKSTFSKNQQDKSKRSQSERR